MNKSLEIWGKQFNLEIVYDVFEGEEVSPKQEEALNKFIESSDLLADSSRISEYIVETSNGMISEPVDNIFEYVLPKSLFIKRSEDKRVVVLLCDYKLDPEHGIALIYEDEVLTNITSEANI
jgi:hypothetical protein